VLAGLGILFGLIGLGSPAPGLSRILSILDLLIDVAIVVLLAQPVSSRYFKPTR
jgi:xanthosine utilization system XapX-like protein